MGHACPLKLGRDEHAADETPRHIPDSTDRPFGLHSATSRRHMPSRTERGTSALAGRGAVPCSKRASFPSSSRTQSSLVAQDWPAQSLDERSLNCRGKPAGGGATRMREAPVVAAAGRGVRRGCHYRQRRMGLPSRRVQQQTALQGARSDCDGCLTQEFGPSPSPSIHGLRLHHPGTTDAQQARARFD